MKTRSERGAENEGGIEGEAERQEKLIDGQRCAVAAEGSTRGHGLFSFPLTDEVH